MPRVKPPPSPSTPDEIEQQLYEALRQANQTLEARVASRTAEIGQVNAILADTRESLKKMDAVLVEAKAVGANARVATEDLGTLRAEVESNLRKVEGLINEINRKWPFKRDTEIKLP